MNKNGKKTHQFAQDAEGTWLSEIANMENFKAVLIFRSVGTQQNKKIKKSSGKVQNEQSPKSRGVVCANRYPPKNHCFTLAPQQRQPDERTQQPSLS
jgi:hypothetical protein